MSEKDAATLKYGFRRGGETQIYNTLKKKQRKIHTFNFGSKDRGLSQII